MLVEKLRAWFGVDFIDYGRDAPELLISSGAGIAMGLMDTVRSLGYMVDIDMYRSRADVDWECLGVLIGLHRPRRIVMCGWFTIDKPVNFNAIERGIRATGFSALHVYRGGANVSLKEFVASLARDDDSKRFHMQSDAIRPQTECRLTS